MIEKCCANCKYAGVSKYNSPCCYCDDDLNEYTPEQFTIPPMPPVTPPKEEINHPDRYKSGKYECIEVMADVFGKEVAKDFCKLNAFKYIWREKQKNGVEDIKKAVWYLNKLIELSENINENV